jgi:hypothetical protein
LLVLAEVEEAVALEVVEALCPELLAEEDAEAVEEVADAEAVVALAGLGWLDMAPSKGFTELVVMPA